MFIASAKRDLAFTLLEVTLAVAILAMMSIAIYRFVQTNIVAMRVSAEADAVDANFDGLREMLTSQLQSLPSGTGALSGDAYRTSGQDRDEITWLCGAGPGLMTQYATGDYRVSLRLRPAQGTKNLDLGLLRRPKEDSAVSNAQETWVRLLPNVSTFQVRYFDSRLNAWVQRWTDSVTLPKLVKFTIGRTDTRYPVQMIVPLARTPL